MGNIIVVIILFLVVIISTFMIATTKDEDKGCNFECENCPFPECSQEEKERIKQMMRGKGNNK